METRRSISGEADLGVDLAGAVDVGVDLAGVDLAGEEAVVAALVGAEDLAGAGKIAKDETRVVLKIIHNARAAPKIESFVPNWLMRLSFSHELELSIAFRQE